MPSSTDGIVYRDDIERPDPEIVAIGLAYQALKDLDRLAQRRVLDWLAARLEADTEKRVIEGARQ